jgi:pyrroloquinoline quinone biosynthesis protein B
MKLLVSFFLVFASMYAQAQSPYVLILGTAQDGGFPQASCTKVCCKAVWDQKIKKEGVSCIAVVDPFTNQKWLFDATPDFGSQTHMLDELTKNSKVLDGIFLTHAHIGHYTGLMYLGREVIGANKTKVYAMPKMKAFLEQNGPWSQLVKLQNIEIQGIEGQQEIALNANIKVKAFRVPHRDEFSETLGYQIITKDKSLVFIPDIDKWQKWDKNLQELVKENDVLLLDGTFYKDGEIARPMAEVPHPFVSETMDLLSDLPITEKKKVHFIHLNHTNPLLQKDSKEQKDLQNKGFKLAKTGLKIGL